MIDCQPKNNKLKERHIDILANLASVNTLKQLESIKCSATSNNTNKIVLFG